MFEADIDLAELPEAADLALGGREDVEEDIAQGQLGVGDDLDRLGAPALEQRGQVFLRQVGVRPAGDDFAGRLLGFAGEFTQRAAREPRSVAAAVGNG